MGKFGQMVRERRKEMGMTLREVGDRSGMDWSNWAKIERGEWLPLEGPVLARITGALELNGSPKWSDTLVLERGRLPKDIADDPEVLAWLAVIFDGLRVLRKRGALKSTMPKVSKVMGLVADF